ATGLRLPATLLFDDPTPGAVADRLHGLLVPEPATPAPSTPATPAPAAPAPAAPVPAGGLEPIAVVGIGCRFPQADRWDAAALAVAGAGDRPVPTRAGFLDGPVDGFDPLFFGISPREAQEMDP